MASSNRGLRIGIQIVLALVIVALAYWLYRSITDPWKVVEQRQELERRTRLRMDDVRQALIRYEQANDRFPGSLDSLVMYIKQDSAMQVQSAELFGEDFIADSLLYSPRGGQFEYAVNDTGRVDIYFLKDPNSEDQIGAMEPDVTMLNAASWE